MADARQVLELAVEEAALMAATGGVWESQIRPLVFLARDALHATDGVIDDERVRESGLHPAKLVRIGL